MSHRETTRRPGRDPWILLAMATTLILFATAAAGGDGGLATTAGSGGATAATTAAPGLLEEVIEGRIDTPGGSTRQPEPELPPLVVSYAGADAIYLSGGRSHGLSVGQQVVVVRDGEPIAELSVAFVSKGSASCRVVDSRLEIVLGDQAIPVPTLEADATPSDSPPAAGTAAAADSTSAPPEPEAKAASRASRGSSRSGDGWGVSGTVSLRWHHFADGSEVPRDFDQAAVRLSLRARAPGSAYEARVRVRGREDWRSSESGPTESERRDRLYELAMVYAPPEGRVTAQVGRLASSPLIGFDFLDGGLAEVRIKPRFGVGGFYGQRSDTEDLDLGSTGQTYGAFFRYRRKRSKESTFYADLLIGGIRELQEGDVSREYLWIYNRLGSGSRWSFYQRADIDVNGSWRREASDQAYQVSNLLVTGNYRFSDSWRLGITYDHRQRYRDFENRDTPEEVFDDRLREGLRLTAQIGDSRGWRLTSSAGIRRQEGSDEDAYSATGSIFHTNLGGRRVLLGVDFSGFAGETSDGYRVSLRGRKYFDGGHDIGLTIGTATTTRMLAGEPEDSANRWIRLNGTARLKRRFFVLAELEITDGDDLAGERLILQLGYRL